VVTLSVIESVLGEVTMSEAARAIVTVWEAIPTASTPAKITRRLPCDRHYLLGGQIDMLDKFWSIVDWLAYETEILEELFIKLLMAILAVSLAATLGITIYRAVTH